MHRLLFYLVGKGRQSCRAINPELPEGALGLPGFSQAACIGNDCRLCVDECPSQVIKLSDNGKARVEIDLGGCIACGLCVDKCPSGTIVSDRKSRVATEQRGDLIISNENKNKYPSIQSKSASSIFKRSAAIRIVSTGCSACDLEIGAAGNPVFDLERFGLHVVASPRFADFLLVTGPVPLAMQAAVLSCYEAMPRPCKVIAVGSCAISGGMHKNSYSQARGLEHLLPVDVFIPGCPPNPWSIIHGLRLAMGQDSPRDFNSL